MNKQNLNEAIREIANLSQKGASSSEISEKIGRRGFSEKEISELSDIASARKRGKEKFSEPEKMFMGLSDIRFATPEIVAEYRAERLKCDVIADLCCGTGMQAISFARKCRKVYAIDIDERKIGYARRNAEVFGIKNITFLAADALSKEAEEAISDAKIIFCDPERAPEEKERNIEDIKIISEIIRKYSKITKDLAFEIPPQITPDRVKFNCELEYLSLNGKLNRLNIYFGNLRKNERSAILLPEKKAISSTGKDFKITKSGNAKKYIYEINPAVSKAGFAPELASEFGLFAYFSSKKLHLLTSDKEAESPFMKRYEVFKELSDEESGIIPALKAINASEVILRGSIDPKEYWRIRKGFERELNSGGKKVQLFVLDEKCIIASA